MKIRNVFKNLIMITLVLGFFFAPVFESASAMSYNYDFWKNIIPSAEGVAHQDTYYSESFDYYKDDEHKKIIKSLEEELEENSLENIKELVLVEDYTKITFDDYNNAKLLLDSNVTLSVDKVEKIKDLINKKQELEKDENLYKKISFGTITDIQTYEDKIYVLSNASSLTISNETGSTTGSFTQLIIINSEMKWEECISEFEITDEVRNIFDDYYQWNRLGFISVASGENHTVAVDKSGNIWAWGSNEYGQLGLDPTVESFVETPRQITWIGDSKARVYTSVYASKNATFVIDSSKQLWAFGENYYNLISSDDELKYTHEFINITESKSIKVKSFSLTKDHAYIIDESNAVWAWGNNSDDLLVLNSSLVKEPTKTNIELSRYDSINKKEIKLNPATIVASDKHTAIIDDENSLWMWGSNEYGQLGLGHNNNVEKPTQVELRKNNVTVKVSSLSLGENHTSIVDKLGNLWTWGSNSHYQLGYAQFNGQTVESMNKPYSYDSEFDYVSTFAFGNSTIATDTNGNRYAFGQNDKYQLGLNSNSDKVEYTNLSEKISLSSITSNKDAVFAIDASKRLWVWGTSDTKLGVEGTSSIETPRYIEKKLELKNISLSELLPSDIYAKAVYVASSKDSNVASVYLSGDLNGASGVAVDDEFIYISDTQNSRILKIEKETFRVVDTCLTPANSTFKQLNLDSNIIQAIGLRLFKPTKIAVSMTGRIYVIADQVYEGIIEFNKQGEYNRYLGQNDVVTNPLKELLRDYLTEDQLLSSFSLTLPPAFTSISIDSKGFIYATSYPDEAQSSNVKAQNIVKAINTSGKDCMKRNGYVTPNGDAVYIYSHTDSTAIIGPSQLVDVAINKGGNFTTVDEVRGRMFTYDSDGNLLYISGNQPGGIKQNQSSGLSENIIKPVAIDYLYRSYIDANGKEVQEELIVVADQQSKSLMVYETTEFGKLVNEATTAYTAGVDTAEKAVAVKNIWLEVKQRNTNYELAYLGIGKCLLVESDYVDSKDEQLKLYKEAMENFKLAHSGIYYSKAYSRYRDQVLKDNFNWIMTGAVIVVLAAAGYIVFKTIKKRQNKKVKVELKKEMK